MSRRCSIGNKRNPETHQAIIRAARELLQEGTELTFEEIARRSGAGKTTIYRWWPQKIDLFMEVYKEEFRHQPPPRQTGTVTEELIELISNTLRNWNNTTGGRIYRFFLSHIYQRATSLEEVRKKFMPEQRGYFCLVLQWGHERGQIRNDLNLETAADILLGFTWHCLLANYLDFNDFYFRQIVDTLLYGICLPEQKFK
ncbi:MAG: TetR/AcrR family transcriptional regulator [Desulfarculales bacterium]|nr:TetR/AcrR family transcriptional regulator [Desulfarculales bacterium]